MSHRTSAGLKKTCRLGFIEGDRTQSAAVVETPGQGSDQGKPEEGDIPRLHLLSDISFGGRCFCFRAAGSPQQQFCQKAELIEKGGDVVGGNW